MMETKSMGLLNCGHMEGKIHGGWQNRWIVDFARAENPLQETKINKW